MKHEQNQKSANAPKLIRCAIYTRKSTEEGLALEFNSLDAQREAAEAYIASQKAEGWVVVPQRFDDGGFSGGSMERPALAALLAAIEAGQVDCVVVYKVDRLSLSLLDFAKIMETFDTHKVSFVSVTQHFNTTHSMGRLTLNILLSFAQFEREIIGERIRDKLAAQRKKGHWSGGVPVLGYDVDRSNPSPKLVINAEEAARVRAIYQLYLQHGSLGRVLVELDRLGWRNKAWTTKSGQSIGGKTFDKGTLHYLLTNPLYAGMVRYKGTAYPGQHEAIIEPATFGQVAAQFCHHRQAGPVVRNKHGALLRGLLYCKACNLAMTHTFTSKGSKRYRYYTCLNASKRGRRCCPTPSLPAGEIERFVVDQLRAMGKDPLLQKTVAQKLSCDQALEIAACRAQHRDLKAELARHHAEIGKLAAHPDARAAARMVELHQKIGQGERQLAVLSGTLKAIDKRDSGEAQIAGAFCDFDALWERLTPREQGRLLALLVARIEFDATSDKIAVQLRETGIPQETFQEAA